MGGAPKNIRSFSNPLKKYTGALHRGFLPGGGVDSPSLDVLGAAAHRPAAGPGARAALLPLRGGARQGRGAAAHARGVAAAALRPDVAELRRGASLCSLPHVLTRVDAHLPCVCVCVLYLFECLHSLCVPLCFVSVCLLVLGGLVHAALCECIACSVCVRVRANT